MVIGIQWIKLNKFIEASSRNLFDPRQGLVLFFMGFSSVLDINYLYFDFRLNLGKLTVVKWILSTLFSIGQPFCFSNGG